MASDGEREPPSGCSGGSSGIFRDIPLKENLSKDSAAIKEIKLLQFKLTMKGNIEPTVWRRFQISSNNSFWDLHIAIQNVMNWKDNHLHRFHIKNPNTGKEVYIGKPLGKYDNWYLDEIYMGNFENMPPSHPLRQMVKLYGKVFQSWKIKTSKYFNEQTLQSGYEIEYIYDYGDYWKMKLEFEDCVPLTPTMEQCICIDGENAAPPEDVGGRQDYEELKTALSTKKSERTDEQEDLIDWVHDFMKMPQFDPLKFDKTAVVFTEGAASFLFHKICNIESFGRLLCAAEMWKKEKKNKKKGKR